MPIFMYLVVRNVSKCTISNRTEKIYEYVWVIHFVALILYDAHVLPGFVWKKESLRCVFNPSEL